MTQSIDWFTGVLSQLLTNLHQAGILTEDLALPEDPDDLEAIYRGLCRVPNIEGSKRRRIDFLTVPWTSRGAALLYYTVRCVHLYYSHKIDSNVQGDDIVRLLQIFVGPDTFSSESLSQFNRAMRMKANVLGYSLNQRGLFGGIIRDPRNRRVKLNTGECCFCPMKFSMAMLTENH